MSSAWTFFLLSTCIRQHMSAYISIRQILSDVFFLTHLDGYFDARLFVQ